MHLVPVSRRGKEIPEILTIQNQGSGGLRQYTECALDVRLVATNENRECTLVRIQRGSPVLSNLGN